MTTQIIYCEECGDTKICQHCSGSGYDPNGAPGDTCPICNGSAICPHCKPDDELNLGPCCACGTTDPADNVRNIFMLHRLCPTPGKGWGCLQCGLPLDYAMAVLCDGCMAGPYGTGLVGINFVCTGYPASDGRTPIEQAPEVKVKHNPLYHPEMLQEINFFDTSPDYGDPECTCSICGDAIPDPDEEDEDYREKFIPLRLFRKPSQKHPHGQEARFCIDCVPAVLKYAQWKEAE